MPILWSGPYDYGIDLEESEAAESVQDLLAEVGAESQ
jgi:cytochrome c oxidase subunit 1